MKVSRHQSVQGGAWRLCLRAHRLQTMKFGTSEKPMQRCATSRTGAAAPHLAAAHRPRLAQPRGASGLMPDALAPQSSGGAALPMVGDFRGGALCPAMGNWPPSSNGKPQARDR